MEEKYLKIGNNQQLRSFNQLVVMNRWKLVNAHFGATFFSNDNSNDNDPLREFRSRIDAGSLVQVSCKKERTTIFKPSIFK